MDARKRLIISLVVLCLVLLAATAGFRMLGLEVRESVFMAIAMLTTTGLRDVDKLGPKGELWVIVTTTAGLAVAAYAFSNLLALMTGGELRKLFGRRKLEHEIANMRDHYIVCGYGRMGSSICKRLKGEGVTPVVIDKSEQRTSVLEDEKLLYILGDAREEQVLLQAGIERAKGLATVTPDDADNVYVTLTARELNKDLMIVARAEQHATEKKLMIAGADRVVCPDRIGAMRITNLLLRPAIVEFVDVAARGVELELDEVEIAEDSPLADQPLKDSELRKRAGALVVAIKRGDGTTVYSPTGETLLKPGDTLITIGQRGGLISSNLT